MVIFILTSRDNTSAGIQKSALLSEVGRFVPAPDQTLIWAPVQSMSFARSHLRGIPSALAFTIGKDYPAVWRR